MLQRLFLASKPVFEREGEEVPDGNDLSRMTLYNWRPEHTGIVTPDLDVQVILDDIDDLIDDERHRPVAVREDQQRLCTFTFHAHVLAQTDERHQMAPVLHHVTTVRQ